MTDQSDQKEKPSRLVKSIGIVQMLFSIVFLGLIYAYLGTVFDFFWAVPTAVALFGIFSGAMLFYKGGITSKLFVGLFWILTIIIFFIGFVVAEVLSTCATGMC